MKRERLYDLILGLCFISVGILSLPKAFAFQNAVLLVKDTKAASFGNCSKAKGLQNCSIRITQNNTCLSQPGSITITNNSTITANNIQASSTDSNFSNYVVQNNGCPASLAPGASCTISFYTNSGANFIISNVLVQGSNTNATSFDIQAFICQAATLTASASNLVLSVTGLVEYGVSGTPASGLARIITLTNSGDYAVNNLVVTPPAWPSGTTSTTTCGNSLPGNSSCTITITPGNTATSDGTNPCSTGTAPIPGVVQATSTNAGSVSTDVVILSYGCISQGGYVYAVDDTPANSVSIGGKVATTFDQVAPATGIIWSSNGGVGSDPTNVSYDKIPGIDETSTSTSASPTFSAFQTFFAATYTNPDPFTPASFNACNGALDGSCNTGNILTFYNQFMTNYSILGSPPFTASNGPTNPAYYGVGLCSGTISGYTGWYLPALCEMGYGIVPCGSSSVPGLQNMQSSLVDFNGLNLLAGDYWSSTEESSTPQTGMWYETFGASSSQSGIGKIGSLGVRCSRALIF